MKHDWVFYSLVTYAAVTVVPIFALIGVILHEVIDWRRSARKDVRL